MTGRHYKYGSAASTASSPTQSIGVWAKLVESQKAQLGGKQGEGVLFHRDAPGGTAERILEVLAF